MQCRNGLSTKSPARQHNAVGLEGHKSPLLGRWEALDRITPRRWLVPFAPHATCHHHHPVRQAPSHPFRNEKTMENVKKNPSLIILFGKCHFRFRCEKPTKNQSEEIHRPPIPTHIDLLESCTVQKIPQAGCRGTRRRRHHHHLPDSDHQTRQREQREQRQYRLRGNRRQANGGNV